MDTVTVSGLAEGTIKQGDIITIAGDYKTVRNPRRRWWSFWRPRFIERQDLREYVVA